VREGGHFFGGGGCKAELATRSAKLLEKSFGVDTAGVLVRRKQGGLKDRLGRALSATCFLSSRSREIAGSSLALSVVCSLVAHERLQ